MHAWSVGSSGRSPSARSHTRWCEECSPARLIGSLGVGFLFGTLFRRNFFGYVFEKTFHYTQEGWDLVTRSFAWFFVFTAVANEIVRLTFRDDQTYTLLGASMTGVDIWIAFKLFIILPLSGLYAWLLTKWRSRHHL